MVRLMVVAPFGAATRRDGESAVVLVRGELDVATVPALEDTVAPLLSDGLRTVVLVLRELDFIDVAGVRLALRLDGMAQMNGTRFVLVRGAPHVHRLFELTGMERFVPAVDDPAEVVTG
jgi:anti-sigma B factor antagonist